MPPQRTHHSKLGVLPTLLLSLLLLPDGSRAESTCALDLLRPHLAIILLIGPANGQILDANDAAIAYYGYSYDQLQAMTIQQVNTLGSGEIQEQIRLAERQQRSDFNFCGAAIALYQAKKKQYCFRFYAPEMHERTPHNIKELDL